MLPDMMPIVIDLPREDIHILPVGDIHIGSKQFNEKMWNAFKESIGDSYIAIVGDCIDNGIKSSVSSTYEQTMMPSAQKEWLYRELEPLADRIICGVGGNHEKRSKRETDQDPLYDVFCRLKIEERYRQSTAFVFVRVNGKDRTHQGKYRPTYSLMVTHGSGGGQLIGAGLNKMQRYGGVVEGLDVLVSGHTHRPAVFVSGKLYCDFRNKRILEKEFWSVTAGSFLDFGGYPLDKNLTPTGHSFPEITLFARKGVDVRLRGL